MRRLPQLNLSPRAKKIAKWAGYPVLALVSFLFALQMTLPYDRVVDKYLVIPLSPKYDVKVGSVGRGWRPFTVIVEKVSLTSRPKKVGDPVSTISIPKVKVHMGVYGPVRLVSGTTAFDFDASIGGGSLSGYFEQNRAHMAVDAELDQISADAIPGIADLVGLPMGGRIEGAATFDLPGGDWRKAEMKLTLSCRSGCTIGDGVAKIYPKPRPGQPQLDGVTVAKLFLTSWTAEFVISKGKGDLKKLEVKSEDGELYVDLHVALQRGITDSTVTEGCIKFKGSETLRKRDEKFYNALNLTGAPLGPDGYHYVKLAGTLGAMRRLPQLCDLEGNGGGDTATTTVETSGHIPQRPPSIRTDNLDTARTPTLNPPSVPQVAPLQTPPPGAVLTDGGGTQPGTPEPPAVNTAAPTRQIEVMPEAGNPPTPPPHEQAPAPREQPGTDNVAPAGNAAGSGSASGSVN